MTDLHELYTEHELNALLPAIERDRLGAVPSLAQCFIDRSATIGEGVKVWHFARVLADAVLGPYVSIGGGTEIGRGSTIGAFSRIGANVFLPPNSVIGERVFIGPNVTCCDDNHPRVPSPGDEPYTAEPPHIDDGASIGAGAVLLPGVRIGAHARVAAGAVVTKDVAPFTMVVGLPAREREPSADSQRWIEPHEALPTPQPQGI